MSFREAAVHERQQRSTPDTEPRVLIEGEAAHEVIGYFMYIIVTYYNILILLYIIWWDGWDSNCCTKYLFPRLFYLAVRIDAPTHAPKIVGCYRTLPDKSSTPKAADVFDMRRGACSSTPHLHIETGHIREMPKVIRDQSHTQGYRV